MDDFDAAVSDFSEEIVEDFDFEKEFFEAAATQPSNSKTTSDKNYKPSHHSDNRVTASDGGLEFDARGRPTSPGNELVDENRPRGPSAEDIALATRFSEEIAEHRGPSQKDIDLALQMAEQIRLSAAEAGGEFENEDLEYDYDATSPEHILSKVEDARQKKLSLAKANLEHAKTRGASMRSGFTSNTSMRSGITSMTNDGMNMREFPASQLQGPPMISGTIAEEESAALTRSIREVIAEGTLERNSRDNVLVEDVAENADDLSTLNSRRSSAGRKKLNARKSFHDDHFQEHEAGWHAVGSGSAILPPSANASAGVVVTLQGRQSNTLKPVSGDFGDFGDDLETPPGESDSARTGEQFAAAPIAVRVSQQLMAEQMVAAQTLANERAAAMKAGGAKTNEQPQQVLTPKTATMEAAATAAQPVPADVLSRLYAAEKRAQRLETDLVVERARRSTLERERDQADFVKQMTSLKKDVASYQQEVRAYRRENRYAEKLDARANRELRIPAGKLVDELVAGATTVQYNNAVAAYRQRLGQTADDMFGGEDLQAGSDGNYMLRLQPSAGVAGRLDARNRVHMRPYRAGAPLGKKGNPRGAGKSPDFYGGLFDPIKSEQEIRDQLMLGPKDAPPLEIPTEPYVVPPEARDHELTRPPQHAPTLEEIQLNPNNYTVPTYLQNYAKAAAQTSSSAATPAKPPPGKIFKDSAPAGYKMKAKMPINQGAAANSVPGDSNQTQWAVVNGKYQKLGSALPVRSRSGDMNFPVPMPQSQGGADEDQMSSMIAAVDIPPAVPGGGRSSNIRNMIDNEDTTAPETAGGDEDVAVTPAMIALDNARRTLSEQTGLPEYAVEAAAVEVAVRGGSLLVTDDAQPSTPESSSPRVVDLAFLSQKKEVQKAYSGRPTGFEEQPGSGAAGGRAPAVSNRAAFLSQKKEVQKAYTGRPSAFEYTGDAAGGPAGPLSSGGPVSSARLAFLEDKKPVQKAYGGRPTHYETTGKPPAKLGGFQVPQENKKQIQKAYSGRPTGMEGAQPQSFGQTPGRLAFLEEKKPVQRAYSGRPTPVDATGTNMVSLPKEPDYTPSPPIQSRGEPAVPAVIALGSRKQAYEQQARTMAKRQDTVEAVNEQAPPAPVAPMSLKERMRLLEESKSGKKAPAPEPVAEPTVSPMQSARERFEHPRSYEAPPEPPHAPEVRSLRDAFERPAPPSPKQEPKEVTAVMSMKAMFDKPEQKPKPKPAVLSMAQQFEKPQPKAKQKVEPRHEFVTAQKHYEVSEPTAVQKMAMGMEAPKAQPKRKTQTAEAIASKKSVFEDKAAAARKTRKTAETEAITSMKEMFNKSPATSPAQSPREALKNKGANKGGASASRTPPAGFNLSPGGKGTATPTDVAYEYDPSTTSLPFPRTDSVISPILRSVQSGLYKDQVPQPQEVEEAREPSLLDGNFIVPPPNNTAAPAPGTTGQNRNEYTEREVRETAAGNVSSDNKSDEFFDTDEERLKILNQSLEAAGNNRSVERKSTGLKVKRASSTSGAQPAAARGQDPAPGAMLSAVLDEYPPNPNAAVPPAQPPPDSTLFWLGVDQTTPDGRPPPNTVPQILPSNPQMQPGSQGSKGAPVSSKGPPVPTSTSGKFSMKGGSAKIIPSVNMISVSGKGSSKGPPVPPVGTTSMKSSKGKGKKSGFTPVSTPPDSDAERTAEVVTNSMPFSKGERPRRSRASQGGPTGPPKVVSASGDVPAWATPANTSNIPFAKGERVRTSGAKIRSSQATNASDGKPFAAPDFVSQLGSVQLKSAKVANPASKPKPMDVGSELANSMRMIREKRAPEVVFEAQGTNRI